MCLQSIFNKEQREQVIDNRTKMTVYKVVATDTEVDGIFPPFAVINGGSFTEIEKKPYEKGINSAKTNYRIASRQHRYKSGFHFFKEQEHAQEVRDFLNRYHRGTFDRYEYKIVKCTIKTEWITDIGTEFGINNGRIDIGKTPADYIAIVAKKAIFN